MKISNLSSQHLIIGSRRRSSSPPLLFFFFSSLLVWWLHRFGCMVWWLLLLLCLFVCLMFDVCLSFAFVFLFFASLIFDLTSTNDDAARDASLLRIDSRTKGVERCCSRAPIKAWRTFILLFFRATSHYTILPIPILHITT